MADLRPVRTIVVRPADVPPLERLDRQRAVLVLVGIRRPPHDILKLPLRRLEDGHPASLRERDLALRLALDEVIDGVLRIVFPRTGGGGGRRRAERERRLVLQVRPDGRGRRGDIPKDDLLLLIGEVVRNARPDHGLQVWTLFPSTPRTGANVGLCDVGHLFGRPLRRREVDDHVNRHHRRRHRQLDIGDESLVRQAALHRIPDKTVISIAEIKLLPRHRTVRHVDRLSLAGEGELHVLRHIRAAQGEGHNHIAVPRPARPEPHV